MTSIEEVQEKLNEVQKALETERTAMEAEHKAVRERRALAAAQLGLEPDEAPRREPEPDDGTPRRCRCGHLAIHHHLGAGWCSTTKPVAEHRVRVLFRLKCSEPHIHPEKCYEEYTESYDEVNDVPCDCGQFDGRPREEVAREAAYDAQRCVSCGHGPEFHPPLASDFCKCKRFVRDGKADEDDRCKCGHFAALHEGEEGRCGTKATEVRAKCQKRLDLEPAASGNTVGTGHYPVGWTCHTCSGYVSRASLAAMTPAARRQFVSNMARRASDF